MFKKFTRDRVGLIMLAVTLLAIGLVAMMSIIENKNKREEWVHKDGRSLSKTLSTIPIEKLVRNEQGPGVLELLLHNQRIDGLSYAQLVDLSGRLLATVGLPGSDVPAMQFEGISTFGMTNSKIISKGHHFIEYQTPIFSNDKLAGYARVGYKQPEITIGMSDVSFYAQMALPVFLLMPIFYFLFRRQTQPLSEAVASLQTFITSQDSQLQKTNNDVDIVNNLRQFVVDVGKHMDELKSQYSGAQESTILLSYQRKRMESVLQSIPEAILVLDETGVVTYANTKLESVLGKTFENVKGLLPHQWSSDAEVISLLSKYYTNNTHLQRAEHVQFSPQWQPDKTLTASAYPLRKASENSTNMGTLVVFRDMTQELYAAGEQENFINHVSHELKSPINVIQMYAETLLDDIDGDKQSRVESLNTIMDETERLTLLVTNLLNISKMQSGNIKLNKQRVKLDSFIEDCFNTVARAAKNGQMNFQLNMPAALGSVQIDKELMRIAINNLLTNAIKYNASDGQVVLQVEESDEQYQIKITDSGVGISEEDLPHIFEKFYRSNATVIRERSGHGLGLALSKDIVALHHGEIRVESVEGEGSSFIMVLYKKSISSNEVMS